MSNISNWKAVSNQRMVWTFMADALEAILPNVVLETEDCGSYYTAVLRETIEMMYQKYYFDSEELEIVRYHREYNFLCAHSFECAFVDNDEDRCAHCQIRFASEDYPNRGNHRGCWMETVVIEALFDKYFELSLDDADIREAIVHQLKKMFRELASLPERDLQ